MERTELNKFIAVKEQNEEILGKIVYYSVAGILIDREEFQQIGKDFSLVKYKPARESASEAFRKATSCLYGRYTVKDNNYPVTYRIYTRDNKRSSKEKISRELVLEELGSSTNEYRKLMNITFDTETESIEFENIDYYTNVNLTEYKDKAIRMYQLYRTCYNSQHVETVLENLLESMQANKISIRGRIFFVPKQNLQELNLFEDFIAAVSGKTLAESDIICNSMFVVDDEKQRNEMKNEFYINYRRDIEAYQERIQKFISNGGTSEKVIERWLQKIGQLQKKKATYEQILKEELTALDDDYDMLTLQAQELVVRSSGGAGFQGSFQQGTLGEAA